MNCHYLSSVLAGWATSRLDGTFVDINDTVRLARQIKTTKRGVGTTPKTASKVVIFGGYAVTGG